MSTWYCCSSCSFKIWFLWIFVHWFKSSLICTIWLVEHSWKAHINNIWPVKVNLFKSTCEEKIKFTLFDWAYKLCDLWLNPILIHVYSPQWMKALYHVQSCLGIWKILTQLSVLQADAILVEPWPWLFSSCSFELHQKKTGCLRVIPGEVSL